MLVISVAILTVAFQVPFVGPLLILGVCGWEIRSKMRKSADLCLMPAAAN